MKITSIGPTSEGGSRFKDLEIEVEVTSGEKRRFVGGDVILVEDTTGTGHRTRTTSQRPRRSLFLPTVKQP